MNEELARYARAFKALRTMTRYLLEDLALDGALQVVTDTALELLPCEHSSIRVLDESGHELLSGARSGRGNKATPMHFQRGEGVVGWVAEMGRLVNIPDTSRDDRFVTAKKQGFRISSIMAAPLFSNGKVIGVLGVTSTKKGAFDQEDELLLQLLANCAVSPIDKARLKHMAVTDPNTKAYNKGYLYPRMHEEMEKARRHHFSLSLLFLDLDHFKRVNDTYGHSAGDVVLRTIADMVRGSVRREDILVRRGGEEFILIMPHADQDEALAVAERLRESIGAMTIKLPDGQEIRQTVSIGVATWDGKETSEELDNRADAAMYQAKKMGRNRVSVSKKETPKD